MNTFKLVYTLYSPCKFCKKNVFYSETYDKTRLSDKGPMFCKEHIPIVKRWLSTACIVLCRIGVSNKDIRRYILKMTLEHIPSAYKCLECNTVIQYTKK